MKKLAIIHIRVWYDDVEDPKEPAKIMHDAYNKAYDEGFFKPKENSKTLIIDTDCQVEIHDWVHAKK